MGEIGRDSEMLLIISERCRDWAMSAQDGNERQTAAGMCTALRQAAYNVNDPERGPLVRFCTAMMGGFAK